ncbi:hypothetical protein Clacol_002732 [Clathrus columnatus]|uniref:Ketoreductase (KR) domain-containing protein n=1 Tax=Clathrus columnatus TaxID=1419009 RepID=A0AAV5A6Z5_9AGAM|nr:hypothetical protein Clacol_002732 [Clathrus columnatus]
MYRVSKLARERRRTTRDRDLHARTIILTGAFTHVGLTLLEHLAKKGAHIIVLLPTPSLTSTQNEILTLLRTATSNEFIYAESCPLESPTAIKEFCQKFVTIDNEQARRIDALILAHEYSHTGSWRAGLAPHDTERSDKDTRSMATFLLTTLLLPAMLVAPIDRDIRIINLVNPFYAAAIKSFDPKLTYTSSDQKNLMVPRRPTILSEGQRSLRTIIFTRHLQRILDALPSSRNPNLKWKKSNIMAISVSPGISISDIVTPALFPSIESDDIIKWSILHVLCVPRPAIRSHLPIIEDVAQTPQQEIPNTTTTTKRMMSERSIDSVEEILVPGALYADCSIVKLSLGDDEVTSSPPGQVPDVNNLGLGDEGLGRSVWEVLEEAVKVWKKEDDRKI